MNWLGLSTLWILRDMSQDCRMVGSSQLSPDAEVSNVFTMLTLWSVLLISSWRNSESCGPSISHTFGDCIAPGCIRSVWKVFGKRSPRSRLRLRGFELCAIPTIARVDGSAKVLQAYVGTAALCKNSVSVGHRAPWCRFAKKQRTDISDASKLPESPLCLPFLQTKGGRRIECVCLCLGRMGGSHGCSRTQRRSSGRLNHWTAQRSSLPSIFWFFSHVPLSLWPI